MIYVHVPFCRSFCTYCDFYSEIACKGRDAAAIEAWADGVCEEVAARRDEIAATLDLDTLYIGGGTPSVLPLSVLRRILNALSSLREKQRALSCSAEGARPGHCFSEGPTQHRYSEFTIEVNPEDIVERGPEYVRGLLDLGVTRISMGVQSLDDNVLRWMNRRHSAAHARLAFQMLRQAQGEISSQDLRPVSGGSTPYEPPRPNGLSAFSSEKARPGRRSDERVNPTHPCDISIDLIIGVPGMTREILGATLEEVIGWRPEHISAYQLSIEEGSALARMIEKGEVRELDEEECRAQYELVCQRLRDAGYHHYEISNWALPGHEAIHNSAYWTRHPYVGLGPGAHSLIGNRRSWNSQVLSGWTAEGEDLTPEQIHTEEVMLLARTDRGPIPERDWFIADDIIAGLI